jgi:hypothetical protein
MLEIFFNFYVPRSSTAFRLENINRGKEEFELSF